MAGAPPPRIRLNLPLRPSPRANALGVQSARARLVAQQRSPPAAEPPALAKGPFGAARLRPASATVRKEPMTAGKKAPIPGYTGFIPHSQHVQGRSYGRTVARCRKSGPEKLFLGDPLPSSPQASPKLDRKLQGSREPGGRIPGYTGFVPSVRWSVGSTFGRTTAKVTPTGGLNAKESRRAYNRASLKIGSQGNAQRLAYFNRGVVLKA